MSRPRPRSIAWTMFARVALFLVAVTAVLGQEAFPHELAAMSLPWPSWTPFSENNQILPVLVVAKEDPNKVLEGGKILINMTDFSTSLIFGMANVYAQLHHWRHAFRNSLPVGTHRLSLDHKYAFFPDLIVRIQPDPAKRPAVRAHPLDMPGKYPGRPVAYTSDGRVRWQASITRVYFQEKKGFDIMGMVTNPMMLISLVSLGMVFILPKMMENLDEETRAQMRNEGNIQGINLSEYFREL